MSIEIWYRNATCNDTNPGSHSSVFYLLFIPLPFLHPTPPFLFWVLYNIEHSWKLEDNLPKLVLSFQHVLPGNCIHRRSWLGNTYLHLLRYPNISFMFMETKLKQFILIHKFKFYLLFLHANCHVTPIL